MAAKSMSTRLVSFIGFSGRAASKAAKGLRARGSELSVQGAWTRLSALPLTDLPLKWRRTLTVFLRNWGKSRLPPASPGQTMPPRKMR